jgi:hypothetical protein
LLNIKNFGVQIKEYQGTKKSWVSEGKYKIPDYSTERVQRFHGKRVQKFHGKDNKE